MSVLARKQYVPGAFDPVSLTILAAFASARMPKSRDADVS